MACLWQQVGESPSKNNIGNHLHNAIIVTISALVEVSQVNGFLVTISSHTYLYNFHDDQQAIGPNSQEYHDTMIVFVEHSINPSNPSSVYLQEDGLILWLAMVRQTETITPSLPKLLLALATLIHDASDSLGILLKIFQSYLLLDCQLVLSTIGSLLSTTFSQLLSTPMGLAPTKAILQSVECIVKCANPSVWQGWFEESDCFLQLMQRSASTDVSRQSIFNSAVNFFRLMVFLFLFLFHGPTC